MIGPEELHLTLIHFGKVPDIYRTLSAYAHFDDNRFKTSLEQYVTATQALLPYRLDRLKCTGYSLFGSNNTTLVARFIATEELVSLHNALVDVLREFFRSIGIADPDTFMKRDPNFMYATELRPHVTLYKGYSGRLPIQQLEAIDFIGMDVLYD